MIPKIIHYCWFGNNPLPEFARKCIESWKKYCPGYKIIEWNEKNFDINCIPFVKQAYEAKKWAFVTDYARLKIVYDNGGVYFDTDVELIKGIDDLVKLDAFLGTEEDELINTGLGFGAKKNHPMIKELMEDYHCRIFNFTDKNLYELACPILTTQIFEKYGYVKNNLFQVIKGVAVFPKEFFAPMSSQTYELNITNNTYSIHHYTASWKPLKYNYLRKAIKLSTRILGKNNTLKLKEIVKSILNKNE